MSITVGKKWQPGAHDISRGTPLGNPFVMRNENERDSVCDRYRDWLRKKIADGDAAVIGELDLIANKAAGGDVVLGCFCAPKRCHGDSVKEAVLERLAARLTPLPKQPAVNPRTATLPCSGWCVTSMSDRNASEEPRSEQTRPSQSPTQEGARPRSWRSKAG